MDNGEAIGIRHFPPVAISTWREYYFLILDYPPATFVPLVCVSLFVVRALQVRSPTYFYTPYGVAFINLQRAAGRPSIYLGGRVNIPD